MTKFKVGDRVFYKSRNYHGTIKQIRPDSELPYCLTVDERGEDYEIWVKESGLSKMPKNTHFTLGDTVEFGGNIGKVIQSNPVANTTYQILVEYEDKSIGKDSFTLDGRLYPFHTKPLLDLITRAKRYKDVKVTVYAVVDKHGQVQSITELPDTAREYLEDYCKDCTLVTLEKTIQIEVQDE